MASPNDSGSAKFLMGFGALFLLVGGAVAWVNAQAVPDPIESAPIVADAQALEAQRPGAAVLVEGKVAATMPVVEEGMAVRQRQLVVAEEVTGKSNEYRLQWRVESSEPGPIDVALNGATVKVGLAAAQWRDPPRKTVEDGNRVSGGKRVIGFAPGDAIAIRGLLSRTREGGGFRVEAEEIFGGTAAEFRADVRAQGSAGMVVGAIFAGCGLVMMSIALVMFRRKFRSPRAESRGSS